VETPRKSASLRSIIIVVATVAVVASSAAYVMQHDHLAAHVDHIDTQYFDTTVRPQDDLYRYINGKWLQSTQIPADRSEYGAFSVLYDQNEAHLHDILSELQHDPQLAAGSDEQKIRDIYLSVMDEARLEQLGGSPIQHDLDLIGAIHDTHDLLATMAMLARHGYNMPLSMIVHSDNHNSTHYAPYLVQSGLELPDRDYYLTDGDDGTYKKVRDAYVKHIANLLRLAGLHDVESAAQNIVKIETDIARAQWDNVTNRDPVKTYNKFETQKLSLLAPELDWATYMQATGLAGKSDILIVQQPSFVISVAKQMASISLDEWKLLLRWKVICGAAPYMSKAFDDEDFAFNGKVLSGQPQQRPRWKRALSITDYAVGEGLGKLYVRRYFSSEDKRQVLTLVNNIIKTFQRSIDQLDWMSPATRQQAQLKLSKLRVKFGYPDKWRDYSALTIKPDDLWGNMMRTSEFYYQRQLNKLGQIVDRDEWEMTPQMVNAYYDPEQNQIVFPAGILQPPFFSIHRDDAFNYGAIGAVIGHEISHGFDDQGRQYDGDGNLRDWWSKEDQSKFTDKTVPLINQFDAYQPVPGHHVNGKLCLGETIADLSGLSVAYKAYQLSLNNTKAPMMDGFTGEQRFFIGWATVWRDKTRDEELIRRTASDPHPPDNFRANGTVINLNAFHQAFDINPGDKMYLPPDKRLSIW